MPPLLACVKDAVTKTVLFLELFDGFLVEFSTQPRERYDAETRVHLMSVPVECQKSLERICWYIREMANGTQDQLSVITTDLRIAMCQVVTTEMLLRNLCRRLQTFLPQFWEFIDDPGNPWPPPESLDEQDKELAKVLPSVKVEALKFLALTLNLAQDSKSS